jgi:hypothetical protein
MYERFARWCRDGIWLHVLRCPIAEADHRRLVDWEPFCGDSSSIRAERPAAGRRKAGRGTGQPHEGSVAGRLWDEAPPHH